ncbi:hypothetical protein SteCoe_35676 [Stentor coeruleus]|uniref:Uncharacterized protein n=1 Tax=Stentor coeruleus TaxID=5963 RepID=A0A1R2ARR7_9CILI|nr:hypothetical protein SteCoe_35676 [Stentor coeruleus]
MFYLVEQDSFFVNRKFYIKEYFAFSFTSDSLSNSFYGLELDSLDILNENFLIQNLEYPLIKSNPKPLYYENKDKTGLILVFAENENNIPDIKSIIDIKSTIYEGNKSKTDTENKDFFLLFMKNYHLDDQKQVKALKINSEGYDFVMKSYTNFFFCGIPKIDDTDMGIESCGFDMIKNQTNCLFKETEVNEDDSTGKSCKNEKDAKDDEIKNSRENVEEGKLLDCVENKIVKEGQLIEENSLNQSCPDDLSKDKEEIGLDQMRDKEDESGNEYMKKSEDNEINKKDEQDKEGFIADVTVNKHEKTDSSLLKNSESELLEENKVTEKTEVKSSKISDDQNTDLTTSQEEKHKTICPEKLEEKVNSEEILKNAPETTPIKNEKPETTNLNSILPLNPTESNTNISISKNKEIISNISNTLEENLTKAIENNIIKPPIKKLSDNKFENTYIFSGPIKNIIQEVNIIFIIIGHESSGRSSFIQTLLNYFEDRNEASLVIEKYIRYYEDKTSYYKYGDYSQTTNELIIVNTQKFDGKKILIVETPHFSEMFSPSFSEETVLQEIRKLFVSNKYEYHIIITKKGDESYMNSNMERCLKSILRNFPNCELHYVYTFYALSIVFDSSLKSNGTTIMKINNNIYLRKQIKSEHWLKLQRKVDKFLKIIFEKHLKKVNFTNCVMKKLLDNPFTKFSQIQCKEEKISIEMIYDIIMENNSLVFVRNKLFELNKT